jgi:hypothetical protein
MVKKVKTNSHFVLGQEVISSENRVFSTLLEMFYS